MYLSILLSLITCPSSSLEPNELLNLCVKSAALVVGTFVLSSSELSHHHLCTKAWYKISLPSYDRSTSDGLLDPSCSSSSSSSSSLVSDCRFCWKPPHQRYNSLLKRKQQHIWPIPATEEFISCRRRKWLPSLLQQSLPSFRTTILAANMTVKDTQHTWCTRSSGKDVRNLPILFKLLGSNPLQIHPDKLTNPSLPCTPSFTSVKYVPFFAAVPHTPLSTKLPSRV